MLSALLYLAVREWSSANVQVWLQQVNQSLHSLYSANFSNHDITGDIMWDCVLGGSFICGEHLFVWCSSPFSPPFFANWV